MNSKPETTDSDEDFRHAEIHLTSMQNITWTIRNVNSLPEDISETLDSPHFGFQNAIWCLRLYPNYKCKRGVSWIGLTLVRLNSRVPHHRLQLRIFSLDIKYDVLVEPTDFDEDHKEIGHMQFIFKKFRDSEVPSHPDIVRVKCEVLCFESHARYAFSQTQTKARDTKNLETVCQNFKNLLLHGQNHDVVLRVKDRRFRAHQDILRVRSPVLESMLSHDVIQNRGLIDVTDCDPEAFQQFLLYLYSGKVDTLDSANVLSVYDIAAKYEAAHLKEVCREFTKNSLTCANVVDVIQLALRHKDALLLESSTDFFTKEICSVLHTVGWRSFLEHNSTQANEILIKAADRLHAGISRKFHTANSNSS